MAACNPTTLSSSSASSKTLVRSISKTLKSPSTTLPFFRPPHQYHLHHQTPISMSSSTTPPPPSRRRKPSPPPIRYSPPSPPSADPFVPNKTLKSRLAAGETLYGLFLLSASPTLAEIAGLAGYDYVVVDMEHGPGGISDALPCLRALAATRTPAVLRLPESSAVWAKKALDLGPQGLMFPMIEDAAAAEAAVSYCRFPPRGVRGSAHTVVRASGYGTDDGYLEHYEEGLLVMCQVETGRGVRDIEAIAAVDGVDCVQMGPLDLSASVGYLWDPGHRKVRDVLAEAERLALSSGPSGGGAYLGGFAMPHDGPGELKKRGYHMVAGAVDLGLFRKAVVEDVSRFRSAQGLKDAVREGEEEEGEEEDGDGKEKGYWSE